MSKSGESVSKFYSYLETGKELTSADLLDTVELIKKELLRDKESSFVSSCITTHEIVKENNKLKNIKVNENYVFSSKEVVPIESVYKWFKLIELSFSNPENLKSECKKFNYTVIKSLSDSACIRKLLEIDKWLNDKEVEDDKVENDQEKKLTVQVESITDKEESKSVETVEVKGESPKVATEDKAEEVAKVDEEEAENEAINALENEAKAEAVNALENKAKDEAEDDLDGEDGQDQELIDGSVSDESQETEDQLSEEDIKQKKKSILSDAEIEKERILEEARIKANEIKEQAEIEAKQLKDQAENDANTIREQAKLDAIEKIDKAGIDAKKIIEQAENDANAKREQGKIDADNEIEKAKAKAKSVKEQAMVDANMYINQRKRQLDDFKLLIENAKKDTRKKALKSRSESKTEIFNTRIDIEKIKKELINAQGSFDKVGETLSKIAGAIQTSIVETTGKINAVSNQIEFKEAEKATDLILLIYDQVFAMHNAYQYYFMNEDSIQKDDVLDRLNVIEEVIEECLEEYGLSAFVTDEGTTIDPTKHEIDSSLGGPATRNSVVNQTVKKGFAWDDGKVKIKEKVIVKSDSPETKA